jgi:hypothetical protein
MQRHAVPAVFLPMVTQTLPAMPPTVMDHARARLARRVVRWIGYTAVHPVAGRVATGALPRAWRAVLHAAAGASWRAIYARIQPPIRSHVEHAALVVAFRNTLTKACVTVHADTWRNT